MDLEHELLQIFLNPFIRKVERAYKVYCINPSNENYEDLTKAIEQAKQQVSEQTNTKWNISNVGEARKLFNIYFKNI